MQQPREKQAQSTECPEKVHAVDCTRLLCIQTWCMWWFVAFLFDLGVCYLSVPCFVRFVEEAGSHRNVRKEKASFATELLLRTI